MAKDHRPYEIFTSDESMSPYAASIRPSGYAYVVSWGVGPNAIVKVGETWMARRWRGYLSRGGQIQRIIRGAGMLALDVEHCMHVELLQIAPLAFETKQDAEPFLGGGGSGWLECYQVDPRVVLDVLEGVLANGGER